MKKINNYVALSWRYGVLWSQEEDTYAGAYFYLQAGLDAETLYPEGIYNRTTNILERYSTSRNTCFEDTKPNLTLLRKELGIEVDPIITELAM
jgi:hypothetical protein